MGKVSVIIVSWNARDYLRGCLQSLSGVGDEVLGEIIVVDNASRDGSVEMVAQEFRNVNLIRCDDNLGFARANNLGIKSASCEYLALINSDVVVHRGCLDKLVAFMDSQPKVGLVGPRILGGDGLLQRSCRLLPGVWNLICQMLGFDRLFSRWPLFSGREMRHWDQLNSAEVEVLSGCFWLARGRAVAQVGGLDERFFFYAEDVDWCKRFREAGWGVFFLAEATATHFGGGSSNNAPLKYCIHMLQANLTYWKKHYGRPGQVVYHAILIMHFALRLVPLTVMKLGRMSDVTKVKRLFDENYVSLRWLLTRRGV